MVQSGSSKGLEARGVEGSADCRGLIQRSFKKHVELEEGLVQALRIQK